MTNPHLFVIKNNIKYLDSITAFYFGLAEYLFLL